MNWSFAIINNRLGEIYFDRNKNGKIKFLGHCYVKWDDFKLKAELKAIDQDIKNAKFIYRNKKYKVVKT